MNIAALQTISTNTILASPMKTADLVKGAKERGYSAVALTDINVTFGLADFYQEAVKAGIKPLLGLQGRFKGIELEEAEYDLVFLAQSQKGYQSLMRLSSFLNIASGDLAGSSPSLADLPELSDLTVIVPAGPTSELRQLNKLRSSGEEYVKKLQSFLPKGLPLYLGVYPAESAAAYDAYVKKLAEISVLPVTVVEDVRYLDPGDQFLCKVLQAIKGRRVLDEHELTLMAEGQGSHWLRPAAALEEACREMGLEEALANSGKIAASCQAKIPFKEPQLPVFPQAAALSSDQYLEKLAFAGLEKLGLRQGIYQARLQKELTVIQQMGFADYFLIVGDIVNYCRQKGALVGPGRGSAAGSLVAYALGITQIDPLKYDLLFERFLNPARANMPDIDLDFTTSGRKLAFAYVQEKYGAKAHFGEGSDLVARILALTTMKAKSVLERTGQVFGLTLPAIARLKQAMGAAKTLAEAGQQAEFKALVAASPLTRLLYQTAQRLEGLPEDTGTHAPGLIISEEPLSRQIGLMTGKEAPLWTVEQTKKYVEKYGLLKIDFLTLDNLELLEGVLTEIQKSNGPLDLTRLPLDDPDTLRLFARGETQQIFQFNSSGMQEVLRKIQPRTFDDLSVAVALYRPGPIASIPLYVARKNGTSPVQYPDPSLKEVLGPTYGIFVYQEQVMQTARIFAGFSLAEADVFRNAISKKQADLLAEEKGKFVAGAVRKGHSRQAAEAVYALIEPFANYGFNHSHAVAYALLAYWQAFLSVHFPREFYLEKLRASRGKEKGAIIRQARKAGVEVLVPDINLSQAEARLFEGRIYLGLKDIMGITPAFLDQLLALNRPVTSFPAFLRQLDTKELKEKQLVPLIEAGLFDQVSPNRASLLVNCGNMLNTARLAQKSLVLQDFLAAKEENVPMPTAAEKVAMEERAMGFAATASPLEIAGQALAKRYGAKPFAGLALNETGQVLAQFIKKNDWRVKRGARAGELGSNAVFSDGQTSEKVTIFTSQYRRFVQILKENAVYLLQVAKKEDQKDSRGYQLILQDLRLLDLKQLEQAEEVKPVTVKPKDLALERYFDQHYRTKRLGDFRVKERGQALAKLLAVRYQEDKRGRKMATLILADSSGRYRCWLFAGELAKLTLNLQVNDYYLLKLEALGQRESLDFKIWDMKQVNLH